MAGLDEVLGEDGTYWTYWCTMQLLCSMEALDEVLRMYVKLTWRSKLTSWNRKTT